MPLLTREMVALATENRIIRYDSFQHPVAYRIPRVTLTRMILVWV